MARLLELIAASTEAFGRLFAAALPLDRRGGAGPGVVYRFHDA